MQKVHHATLRLAGRLRFSNSSVPCLDEVEVERILTQLADARLAEGLTMRQFIGLKGKALREFAALYGLKPLDALWGQSLTATFWMMARTARTARAVARAHARRRFH
jgi:hypothetical protein